MALAITDDHAMQDAAFYDAPDWQRQPHALRHRLTERDTRLKAKFQLTKNSKIIII